MKSKIWIISAILLSGCATVHESFTADGTKAFALNCSGTARGWDKCYIAAGEKCGSVGYTVLERNSERLVIQQSSGNLQSNSAAAAVSNNRSSAAVAVSSTIGSFNKSSTETQERTMLIACKQQIQLSDYEKYSLGIKTPCSQEATSTLDKLFYGLGNYQHEGRFLTLDEKIQAISTWCVDGLPGAPKSVLQQRNFR